ncbi:hypothetical protein F4819DRAFT_505232 [Hypoxylon fuscum]|nr:hypothetical protein F4819DRAFT_505232 [Hypoxylon fuscum]
MTSRQQPLSLFSTHTARIPPAYKPSRPPSQKLPSPTTTKTNHQVLFRTREIALHTTNPLAPTFQRIDAMAQYKTGQSVRYKPVGGPDSNTSESTGKITGVLTQPGVQADRNVQASREEPRYEIQNDNTGKLTAVYEKNILGSS